MRLNDLIPILEDLAPPELAESWDNTGLLIGDRNADIERVLTCLTLTPDVAAEAIAAECQLVVTHHPVLFKAVQRLTSETGEGRMLLSLMRAGVAVYSPHTCWDNAPLGINQQLAEWFELQEIGPIRRRTASAQVKLVTFVPEPNLQEVQRALFQAGCGVIGNYSECSYLLRGTGTFKGDENSNPTIGQAGQFETVDEVRLETVCPKRSIELAIRALRHAHPYEEPAFDILPLESPLTDQGSGRVGKLLEPMTLRELVDVVQTRLRAPGVQFAGDPELRVSKLGIACGSAGEFWRDARSRGCQALLTGETRFHTGLEARDANFGLIIVGHYASERPAMERFAVLLQERCEQLTVSASASERDPFQ